MKIAVVIPALEEADQIAGAIRSARAGDRDVEVLVVDGGSRDDTPLRAKDAGADVLVAGGGRALQLQSGWRATAGDVVLFLHADTRLEAGWADAVRAALAAPDVVGGAFRLHFEGPGWRLRLLELGARLRVGLFGLPYGDQAIFVRRRVLDEMGGIPYAEVMEDLDLVQALKSRGRLAQLSLHATTSPRRYVEGGLLRTMLRHWLALLIWRLGLDRARVARWSRP